MDRLNSLINTLMTEFGWEFPEVLKALLEATAKDSISVATAGNHFQELLDEAREEAEFLNEELIGG